VHEVGRIPAAGELAERVGCLKTAIHDPSNTKTKAEELENSWTYRIANLRGFAIMIGHKAKHMTKQASAPRLQPLNINIRSHLLTVGAHRQPLRASPE
jgi:hypothetical protein